MNAEGTARNQRLKWCFESCKNGSWGEDPDGLNDVVCIRAADFDGASGRLAQAERTIRAIDVRTFAKVALRRGDLVIEKSGGGDKQLVGRTVVYDSADPAVCSNFLARMRLCDGMDAGYINYLLLSSYNARGTYPHIKQSTGIQNLDLASYLSTRADVPPLETQCHIACFLDAKTALIDALIAKKRVLLERLAEKHQAVITQAVTKGLDPGVPMKDSRIDWLGEIPARWALRRLRFDAYLNPKKSTLSLDDEAEVSFVPMDAVGTFGGLDLSVTRPLGDVYDGYTYFAEDDVCVAKITPCFENGKGAIAENLANDVGFGTTELHVIRCGDELEPKYLFYATIAYDFRNVGASEMLGAGGQKRVPECFIKDWMLPKPSLEEQRSIVRYLDAFVMSTETTVGKLQGSVERLTEYRAALITAAVTGQLEIPADGQNDRAEEHLGKLATEVA